MKTDNTAYQALVLVWLGCGKNKITFVIEFVDAFRLMKMKDLQILSDLNIMHFVFGKILPSF